jgi:hypothetical protein
MSDTHLLVSLDWQGQLHRIGHLEIIKAVVGKITALSMSAPGSNIPIALPLTRNSLYWLICRI